MTFSPKLRHKYNVRSIPIRRSTVPFSSELRHKYNVRTIPIRKDDEVQVDCDLLLRAAP